MKISELLYLHGQTQHPELRRRVRSNPAAPFDVAQDASRVLSPERRRRSWKITRRGVTILELIFAMGLGLSVLAVGYKTYFIVTRASDIEAAREETTMTALNLMASIRRDVRASRSVAVSTRTLVINTEAGRVVYAAAPDASGVQRAAGRGRRVYHDVSAAFASDGGVPGVRVELHSRVRIHERAVGIDLSSFVSPRNR